jgi:hypothetical protein
MAKEINIRVKIPEDFSKSLDNWIYELRQIGVKKTKSELITKYAMMGFIQDHRNNEAHS